ncbi:Presequence protease [Actinidia chinensis var. chinensis]|uniref:Presequence protease n=1 Tax=Actinidia chinensis var. chinensis TaxID=1590841 RepID=A0A2R6QUC8_ACTCC|nr:Presequence protease [Actinidia chinensis var. chinensis]
MEIQTCETISLQPRVKATIRLGSETYCVQPNKGILSEQLASMKEESMSVLKDFITKHNVPNDVPDETDDMSSEDDDETPLNVTVNSKKQRK